MPLYLDFDAAQASVNFDCTTVLINELKNILLIELNKNNVKEKN